MSLELCSRKKALETAIRSSAYRSRYHDRSDGGLFTTLVEMMFAGRCGMNIILDDLYRSTETSDIVETLFNEELGAVTPLQAYLSNSSI